MKLSTIKTITDWRIRDADLPLLAPGKTFERVIASQKFVVLMGIVVEGAVLVSLRIGVVENIPFELEGTNNDATRTYKPARLGDFDLGKRLVTAGAAVATKDSIALAPGLEVRSFVRNDGPQAAKFRVALVVQEEP